MKTEARKELIDRLEQELDRQINVVVRQFQNLSNEQLIEAGENGRWSIAQNLEHLNMYFDYYNPVIKKALEKAKEEKSARQFHSGWLGSYFSRMMDYRTNKKIKAFKDYIPSPDLNAPEVTQRFIENEEEFLSLLRKAKDYNLTKIRIPISLTRWITMRLGDVFQFVLLHNERHLKSAGGGFQIED